LFVEIQLIELLVDSIHEEDITGVHHEGLRL
jgi:hypothetical protein